jgi:hypothetical protein
VTEQDLRCEGTVQSKCGIVQGNSVDRSVFWAVMLPVMEDMNMCLILNADREREREGAVWVYKYKSFVNGKGKGVPYQARCGPEGSRRFRLPDFMTFCTRRW